MDETTPVHFFLIWSVPLEVFVFVTANSANARHFKNVTPNMGLVTILVRQGPLCSFTIESYSPVLSPIESYSPVLSPCNPGIELFIERRCHSHCFTPPVSYPHELFSL
jgi:hypothetical protein